MWLTDRYGPQALAAALALAIAGCTTPIAVNGPAAPLTPLDQYSIQVEQTPDQLALAPHAEGLSGAQQAAIAAFAERWRESGRADIAIRTPDGQSAGPAVERTTADLLAMLQEAGVPGHQVRVGPYEGGGAPGAPVLASFMRYEARGPNCETGWDNWGATAQNRATSHFGCAVTANIAAMIADPRDLMNPAPSAPADATRRANVLARYREGQTTSSARDNQATGVVSQAVQ